MTEVAGDFPVSYWRALLDTRWQAELRRVTELSVAFWDAAEHRGPRSSSSLRRAESRAVAARRSLADIEDAMARLTSGRFGRCEQCETAMPARWLARTPEARYCPRCSPGAAATARLARSSVTRPVLTEAVALVSHFRHAFHVFRPGVIPAGLGNG
jgi:RNA polymerase-binding transcription factor DksA